MLSVDDARDLDAYFQIGCFEKSTYGPMVERLNIYALCKPEDPNVEYTARPTAEIREPGKAEMDLRMLDLIGRVSRKLKMVGPVYRRALEAFFGDRGACCAERVPVHGRLASLFEFTPAGRALAKRERLASGKTRLRIKASELIENAVARKEDSLSSTVALTVRQALELQARSEAAYTEATRRLDAERPSKELGR